MFLRLVSVLLLLKGLCLAGNFPDWLAPLISAPPVENSTKAPAEILLEEDAVEVDELGVAEIRHRKVVRILHVAGKDQAADGMSYNSASDKVLSAEVWFVRGGKNIHDKKQVDWMDVSMNESGTFLTDMRGRSIYYGGKALPGDIFAVEIRISMPLLFAQWISHFRNTMPTARSVMTMSLPKGFVIEKTIEGETPPEESASTAGNHCSWAYSNLPYKPDEVWTHPMSDVNSVLYLRIKPKPGAAGFKPIQLDNWSELATWDLKLNAGQCDSSPLIKAKTAELTKECPDNLAKIGVLAQHCQKNRYIAVNQGLHQGLGYQSRKASKVFSNGYGDCKDKSNLLKSMLNEIGIRSHMVSAYSGRDSVVKTDFPAPGQFNHAILAIEVGPEINLPAVVDDAQLGRLLFFDPTDPFTPLGDLPFRIQGSFVQVLKEGNNQLTKLPSFSARAGFATERQVEIALQADGSMQAKGLVRARAQSGSSLRSKLRTATTPKTLEELISSQLSDSLRSATLTSKASREDLTTDTAELSFELSQKRCLQPLQQGKSILKLDVFGRRQMPKFAEKERIRPVDLVPLFVEETITVRLPDGFGLDEPPASTSLKTAYGEYSLQCKVEGQTLTIQRQIEVRERLVPTSEYQALRQFLSDLSRLDKLSLIIRHGS